MDRIAEIARFYELLDKLEQRCGGRRLLCESHGRMGWPRRGVYFFFEQDERRADSGTGDRLVRIGTHALKEHSRSKLWGRLSQHRGSARSGGGNHRTSIFRLLVGSALRARADTDEPRSWGVAQDAGAAARKLGVSREALKRAETALENDVSRHIGAMPFVWLSIADEPGPDSERGYVERNAIALLSNRGKAPVDAPSPTWLGTHSDRDRVRESGLWNNNHVDDGSVAKLRRPFLDR